MIPAGWESVTAGQLASKRTGSVDPAKFPDEIFDLYSIPSYDTGEPEVLAGREIGSSKKVVQEGDILISKIVPHIRRVWIVGPNRGRRQIASGEWISFSDDEIHPDYLRYFLLSDGFHTKFMSTITGVGGSLLRARPSEVNKIEIPLPPLATQQHIARVLEQADQLRKQAQQMERELNQLAQSLFLEMFGDPVTNPKGFRVVNIQEVVHIRDGTHDTPSYVENGIPFVTSTHLRGDYIDFSTAPKITEADHRLFSKRSLVEDGDILFGMIGTVGNATLVKKNFEFSIKNVALFKPLHDRVSPYYLWMYLRNEKFLHHLLSTSGKGGNQKFVALGPLRGIDLMLPPQELMADFATRLSAILERRRMVEGQALTINDMFNSLMQRAFNGELTAPERKAA